MKQCLKQICSFFVLITSFYIRNLACSPIFEIEYQWQYINFTWPSQARYNNALRTKAYIPENVATLGSIKYFKNRIYLTIPQLREGVPITVGYISTTDSQKFNALITPYPSWQMNIQPNCNTLQSVLSLEIDRNGIMWVIDGVRINNNTKCPPKLLLLDTNNNGKVILSYTFRNDIVPADGAFLNDIVLDKIDGGYAYITDNNLRDPGLVVFSRRKYSAWKLRDSSMFAEVNKRGFVVNGLTFNQLSPINGIALSPPVDKSGEKIIFYSSLTGAKLHSLSTIAARNYSAYESGDWRSYVKFVGKKQAQGDGMSMDNKGNLYYGILSFYAVGRWNMHTPFSSAEIITQDNRTLIWVDAFGYDETGNLLTLADNGNRFLDTSLKLSLNGEIIFRILKAFTDTKSYLYY